MKEFIPPGLIHENYNARTGVPTHSRAHAFNTNGSLAMTTMLVENSTTKPIMLIDRAGIITFHEPIKTAENFISFSTSMVKIKKIYDFRSRQTMEATIKLLENSVGVGDSSNNEPSCLLRHLKEVLVNSPTSSNMSIEFVYEFDISCLTSTSPRRYIENLDVVVDTFFDPNYSVHPHSPNGQHINSFLKAAKKLDSLTVSIDIIDNTDTVGPRFTSIMGQTVKIEPRKDPSLDNGVHLGVQQLKKDGTPLFSSDIVPLTNMEDIRLYPTAEQAEGHNDASEKMKQANKILEAQLVAQGLKTKEAHSKAMTELEEERNQLKVQFETVMSQIKTDSANRASQQDAEHQALMNSLKQQAAMASFQMDASKDTVTLQTAQQKAAIEAIVNGIAISHKQKVNEIDLSTKVINALPAVIGGAATAVIAMKLFDSRSGFGTSGVIGSGFGKSSW